MPPAPPGVLRDAESGGGDLLHVEGVAVVGVGVGRGGGS